MKILFVIRYTMDADYHLNTKYSGMVRALRGYGHDVDIIGQAHDSFYLIRQRCSKRIALSHCGTALKKLGSISFYYKLFQSACTVLNNGQYDVIYIREPAIWFHLPKLARLAQQRSADILVEIPTFPPQAEIQRVKNIVKRALLLLNLLYEKMYSHLIQLYVVIGENVGGYYNGQPAVNITNAIDVAEKSVRMPRTVKGELHMLALSAMTYWQGFDRIIEGMRVYSGEFNVFLHLVGDDCDGTLRKLVALGKQYRLEHRVVAHGALYGKALDNIFDKCDVGFGTLGMYRKGMSFGSVLKIRDYMARGLPFVYATEDDDLRDDTVGCLKISNDDVPVNIKSIVDFAITCKHDNGCINSMRTYAMNYMTWDIQINRILKRLYTLHQEKMGYKR